MDPDFSSGGRGGRGRGRGRGGRRGRGRGRGGSLPSPPTVQCSLWLSAVTMEELQAMFGVTYREVPKPRTIWPTATPELESAAAALRRLVMGGDDDPARWERMSSLYRALFSDAIPDVPQDVTPLLAPIFHFVAATRGGGINIFSNGAGKRLACKLLELLPIGACVRIGTTGKPKTDWCGIETPELRGVVDVAVVKGGAWLLVGEIKGGNASPFTQILAAMQAVKTRDGIWPYGEGFGNFEGCYI